MTGEVSGIALSKQDLREVTAFAAACAEAVLEVFEGDQPDDLRQHVNDGRCRTTHRLLKAWAALKAAKNADTAAARDASRQRRVAADGLVS